MLLPVVDFPKLSAPAHPGRSEDSCSPFCSPTLAGRIGHRSQVPSAGRWGEVLVRGHGRNRPARDRRLKASPEREAAHDRTLAEGRLHQADLAKLRKARSWALVNFGNLEKGRRSCHTSVQNDACGGVGGLSAANDYAMSSFATRLFPIDPAEALELKEQAIARGNSGAMYLRAYRLRTHDPVAAQRWFEEAAERGNPRAMVVIGKQLSDAGDKRGAEEWWRRAADLGNDIAMSILGDMVRNSNRKQSLWWLWKALHGFMACCGTSLTDFLS
jgi:TPR repeat protein